MDLFLGTKVIKSLKEIESLSFKSSEEVEKWQLIKLKQLLIHAYENTTYYNKLFNECKINVNEFREINQLKNIPKLTKKIIRENYESIQAINRNNFQSDNQSTGGSSGEPLKYILDRKSWSFATAANIFNWQKNGYIYGSKYLALGSSSLFVNKKSSLKHKLYYFIKGKYGVNGVNMSDNICKEYIEIINKKKIRYIYGYASAIYLLADYAQKNKIGLQIEVCFTTSEICTEIYSTTIIKSFNCKLVDCYGANDGGITAFANTPGFFEVSYNSIVQFENTESIEQFNILLTDLFNYSMPLINYEVGDEVFISSSKQLKKYNGQFFNRIIGRNSEIIRLENGKVLTGPGFTILFKDLPVEYYNIKKIDFNYIQCYIKKMPEFDEKHENLIKQTIYNMIGSDARLEIIFGNDVFYTKNGKRKYFG